MPPNLEPSQEGTQSPDAGAEEKQSSTFSTVELVDQYRALLAASDDAILIKSLDNIITNWSDGAERLYGYTGAEIVGRPVQVLSPHGRQSEAEEICRKVGRGETLTHFQTVRIGKNGAPIDVILTAAPVRDPTGKVTGILSIGRDVRERVKAEINLRESRKREANSSLVLDTASRVALDILSSLTGREALYHIADAARKLAGARYAALGVARPQQQELMEFVTVGLNAEEEARIGSKPLGRGVLGLLLQRSEPLRIPCLRDHPASIGFPPNHPPMESFLGVPIRQGEVVLGSLYLTDKIGGADFTEADERAVQSLGSYAAVAIYNLHMLLRQRALVSNLIQAQEEERRAMAYDLHDGLTQYVMACHAHLEAHLSARDSGNIERAQREIGEASKYVKEAVQESRRLINGLRSLALDDLGLEGAVEQLIAEEKARSGWEHAELAVNLGGRRFDTTVETALYRVIQEAITNIRKHSGAHRVEIIIRYHTSDRTLGVEVRDWGRGFSPEQQVNDASHVGLQGMAERINLIGGSYDLVSAPGQGTIIRVVVPALEIASAGDKA